MSDAKIIRAKLRRLLPQLDENTATARTVQQRLEEDLGIPLDDHKKLIIDEIDSFLLAQEDEGGDKEYRGEEQGDEEAPEEPAPKKQKAAGGSPAKPPAGRGELSVELSATRFAGVRQFKGRWSVDVREFYDKGGQLAPGTKGASLAPDMWRALTEAMPELTSALESGDDSKVLELSHFKRASICKFSGRATVDLREYYEKDGAMKPTKKGIALPPDQWARLCAAAARLTEALVARAGPPPARAAGGAGPSAPAAAPAAAGATPPAASPAPGAVELSRTRRAEAGLYQGKALVSIREYYEKGGQMLPGKKGISLSADQFAALAAGAERLSQGQAAGDTSAEVELSKTRKASISSFKGTTYVSIREYYEKDGELLPGQKGISLPPDQWARLAAGLPGLQAAAQALQGGR